MGALASRKQAVVLMSVLALGGATAWWATRGGRGPEVPTNVREVNKVKERHDLTKQEFVAALAKQGTQEATDELVKSYVNWSSAKETMTAREDILDALYKIESVPRRLKAVIDAIAGDPTPPDRDPLWGKAVDRMARTLAADPSRLQQEQDLMLMEKRERAQQFLTTSMSQFAQSSPGTPSEPVKNMSEDRRSALCQDLIDAYFKSGNEAYRRELVGGVEATCGHDAAVVLTKTANGLQPGDLKVLVENDQAMKDAINNLGKGQPIAPRKQ